jgi:Regulator of ribonuclease activity B
MRFLERFKKPNPFREPAELDKLSLTHLEKLGADLALPRHVIHFIYFDREEDARAAAEEIPEAGWDATVEEPSEGTSQWVIRAEATRVVDPHTVPSYRAWFEELASRRSGEYDGWEAAAKP